MKKTQRSKGTEEKGSTPPQPQITLIAQVGMDRAGNVIVKPGIQMDANNLAGFLMTAWQIVFQQAIVEKTKIALNAGQKTTIISPHSGLPV